MRLLHLSVLFFVIYLSIGVFDQVFDNNLQPIGGSLTGNFVLMTLLQPQNWSTNGLLIILGLGIVVGTVAALAGSVSAFGITITRSDISALFPLFLVLVGLGSVPIISFYSFITRNVGQFACTVGSSCPPAMIIGSLTAGVLALVWIFTCLEWWLWRPMAT